MELYIFRRFQTYHTLTAPYDVPGVGCCAGTVGTKMDVSVVRSKCTYLQGSQKLRKHELCVRKKHHSPNGGTCSCCHGGNQLVVPHTETEQAEQQQ